MAQIDEQDRAILRNQAQEALRPGLDSHPPSLFIFVGAGVSIATTQGTCSPAVGWKELLRRGCRFAEQRLLERQRASLGEIEEILDDERATAKDLTRAAEDLERLLGLVSFTEFLEAEFRPQQRLDAAVLQAHPLYRQLMRLREAGARLVTVNYDTLIEHANGLFPIDWTSPDVNNFFQSRDPVPDKLVLHLHGRWNNPRSVVFGTTTYSVIVGEGTAARDVQTIRARLQSLLAEKHVVFVGCGDTTSDPHFVKIFEEYERTIDIPTRRHVHLCTDSEFSRFRRNMPDHVVTMPYGAHADLANGLHFLFPEICPLIAPAHPSILPRVINTEDNATSNASIPVMGERYHQCLADLRVTDPRHDKKRIEDTAGGLFRESYCWILEHADFSHWLGDQNGGLLWIQGDPGKGKTMLLCAIINELEHSIGKSITNASLLSFFFCQATDSRINSATAVLRSLIYQLLDQQPSLMSHIPEAYDRAGKALFEDVNAWYALSGILVNILHDPKLPSAFLLIDALDECLTGLEQLLEFLIQESSASSRVRWLVSSRKWRNIEEVLNTAEGGVRLSLELNEKSIAKAVSSYIEHKVCELAKLKKYDNSTKTAVQSYLAKNSNDTFLWVASVCKELKKTPAATTVKQLTMYPPGLDELYKRMIQQVYGSKEAELCKQILSVVTIVYRPITLSELTSFVGLAEISSDNLALWEQVVELCGSFLAVREGTIYFVHQSVKEFLLITEAASQLFRHGIQEAHHIIFANCLKSMSKTLRRDIYNLGSPGFPIADVKPPEPDPLATIRYSCIHWVDHLYDAIRSSEHRDHEDQGAVHQFLSSKCLYWLEGLSLLRSVPKGVHAVSKLEELIQVSSGMDIHLAPSDLPALFQRGAPGAQETSKSELLMKLVRDTRRFILYFKVAIEHSPLQIYVSGLVFSPTSSPIKDLFKAEEPRWIITKPAMPEHWAACLQTLEGHGGVVNSVAFSHDSMYLASGSSDGTVKIWDAASGGCIRTLEGHGDWVTSVAFSHDSKYLASGSSDGTVKIWDAAGGGCIRTLEGHEEVVKSVAFSHDSQYLASGSSDGTVKLWDTAGGGFIRTLEGHRGWVISVAFSPDSKYLASASWDSIVEIWDTASGGCVRTLVGDRGWVKSVAFSHDSMYLASGSSDGTVKIWDTASGGCVRTLEGHRGGVTSVAFSHDSKYLASGSSDGTVKIWDTASGGCVRTLEGHRGGVTSVAFSSDSQYLASAFSDGTLKIWDTAGGGCIRTLEGHEGVVDSIAFSPDSKYLESVSNSGTVEIWDISSGYLLPHSISDVNPPLNTSFDDTNSSPRTHSGSVPLYQRSSAIDPTPKPIPHQILVGQGYRISPDKTWILWNSKGMLWLPPEYRPSSKTIRENLICIGCRSGRVLIFKFSAQPSFDQRSSTSGTQRYSPFAGSY